MELMHFNTDAIESDQRVRQQFPFATLGPLAVEHTLLSSLVHHQVAVDHDSPLEEVEKVFRERQVDYVGILRGERVVGICARVKLGALLGSRFGFALYGKSPAIQAQVDHPLVFSTNDPVRVVLSQALARRGAGFHEDVALVSEAHEFLGLVSIDALAQLQSRLVGEQMEQLRRQSEILQRQNVDLFQAGHAQRQAQGLYQCLFDSNALGVALLGSQGTVQAHNRRLAELLNLEDGSIGITFLTGWLNEADRQRFQVMIAAHGRDGLQANCRSQEFTFNVAGVGPRVFHITTGWIRETGQVCAFVDDITEQRSLEMGAIRQEKQRLLDTLIGGIAHELNNKLMPVFGFAEVLGDTGDMESSKMAQIIKQSAREAADIIKQLLQLSKPDTGSPRPFNLCALVEESLLMTKFQLREARIVLVKNLEPTGSLVLADPAKIRQVIINLILNAIDAMEGIREPSLRVSVCASASFVSLAVRDNGCGISLENQKRIFDPFFTTKAPDRGTGLGLSICYSVVRQFNGEIAVDSQPGVGATFTVTLPRSAQEERSQQELFPVELLALGRPTRVLVVDDEEVVRLLLQRLIRSSFGSLVDLAANGADAMALVNSYTYDLVISDIRMPIMTGTELYLRLKDSNPNLAGHFVFITGHPGSKSLQEEISKWKVPVLSKPFSSTDLTSVCGPLLMGGRPDHTRTA